MPKSRLFFVNGTYIEVPEDEIEEFMSSLNEGDTYEEADNYSVNGQQMQVPRSQQSEFFDNLNDDELSQVLDEDAMRNIAEARESQLNGHDEISMSRGLFKNAGMPERISRTKEGREGFADRLLNRYRNELTKPDVEYGNEENFGDEIWDAANEAVNAVETSPTVAGAVGAAKGFYEGAVGNPSEAIDEFYGEDSAYGNALKGGNDFANKLTKKIMSLNPAAKEVVAQALGGESTELGKALRENAQADRATLDEALPTDTAYVDESLQGANDFIGDTLSTVGTFAIPGAAAVDISANTANAYYDAYERAKKSGQPEAKAQALAAAKSGATAAMGVVLGKAAKGARSAEGFMGALTDMAVTGGEMGALGAADDVIEQGIEGADNPDLARTAEKFGEEAAKGAAFSGISRAAHSLANENGREIAKETEKTRQERAEEEARENERAEKKSAYDAKLSEEAINDIDDLVAKQVDAGTIPSWRNAEEVTENAKKKLVERGGREAGDNHEAVEMAVIEAAQEVQERLQTPSRVEDAALERRQTEAKMRDNEYWAKRSDELAEEYGKEEAAKRLAEEQAAVSRKAAAEDARVAEHNEQQSEIEAAFENWKEQAVKKNAARKSGKPVKDAEPMPQGETAEDFESFVRSDPQIIAIDKEWQTAKTAIDKGDLEFRVRARLSELRDEWAKRGEKVSKTDSEVSKTDVEAEIEPEVDAAETAEVETPIVTDSQKVSQTENKPTDAGFKAWAVGRDGQPLEFASKKDEQRSRALFNKMVANGQIDGATGERIEVKETAKEPEVDISQEDTPIEPVAQVAQAEEAKVAEDKDIVSPSEAKVAESKQNQTSEVANAAKILGTDAYLPEKDLRQKLATWKKNVNNFAGERKAKMQAQIDAAEQVLAARKAEAKVDENGGTANKADRYAEFLRARIAKFKNAKTSKEMGEVANIAEGELDARKALTEDKEALDDFNRRYGELLKEEREAIHQAVVKGGELRESERAAYESSPEHKEEKLRDANEKLGYFVGERGVPVDAKTLIDRGWKLVRHGSGAVQRWHLEKEGVGYHDLSSKKITKAMGGADIRNEAIKILEEYASTKQEAKPAAPAPLTNVETAEQKSIVDIVKENPTARLIGGYECGADWTAEQAAKVMLADRAAKGTATSYGKSAVAEKPVVEKPSPLADETYVVGDKKFVIKSGQEGRVHGTWPDDVVAYDEKGNEVARFSQGAGKLSWAKDAVKSELESKYGGDKPTAAPTADGKKPEGKGVEKDKIAKALPKDGTEIVKQKFGNYDVNITKYGETHNFKIRKDKKTGDYSIVDADGDIVSTVGNHDAFESTEEIVNYLKEQAEYFVNGDWDVVDEYARRIAEKKTKAYADEIGKLKRISLKDKKIFDKLARDYEDWHAELRHEGLTEKEVEGLTEEDLADKGIEKGTDQYNAASKFIEARDALERFHEQAVKYEKLKRDKDGRPIWQVAEESDIAMRANDPKRRSRAEVLDWAKREKRQIIDGKVTPDAMREYDAQMAQKATKAVKRLFPDMKVEYYDKASEMGGEGKRIEMRNKHGEALGWFSPSTKQVTLLPGADAETVAHEIGWHGVRDWAQRNSPKLMAKMREVEDNVDPELRTKVLRMYRKASGYNRDDLLNEFGAWTFMGHGGKELEQVVSSKEGAKWYAQMLNAAKDIYKDYATKHGGNRIDLSQIDQMDGDAFMDYMAKQIAGGKTLGNIGTPGAAKAISTKESKVDWYKRKAYDVGAVFRSVEKDIEKKTGNKIDTDNSVDQAFGLRPGLHEASNIRFKGMTDALKAEYKKQGVNHDDFAYYMACKAATGRDAKIDTKNIKALEQQAIADVALEFNATNRGSEVTRETQAFKDAVARRQREYEESYRSSNGSNIDPKEAAKTVKEWESGDMAAKTEALRKQWRKIINETIDRQVEAGLVSKEQADQWKREEPDYVPFKSPIDEVSGEYYGRGTNLARPEHHEAKGRKTAAGNVLTHALVDWQSTENRAIENELRQKLAKMIEDNPELGTIEKLGNQKIKEQRTKSGKGETGADPNVIIFKRDGESYIIRLNGERGSAMAAAITGRNLTSAPSWMQKASRVWASFATEWSPTFAIRNTIKDNIELGNIVLSEMGPVKGAKFAAHYAKGQVKNAGDVWKFARDGKVEKGSELENFINDGGMIGGIQNEGYGDLNEQFSGKSIDQLMKSGEKKQNAINRYTIGLIGSVTKMSELQTRVNAYAAAKATGMSGKEAALWSRRAVTDFNRKGENTGWTNVLRMFSNSTLGATARSMKALTTNKYGAMAAATFVGYGYLQAMLENAMNEDSDEKAKKTGEASTETVSEYERQNSALLIRDGNKEYRVPMHESPFSMLKYFGDCVYRVQHGKMTKAQMAKELGLSVATLASHLSGWGDINFDSEEKGIGGTGKAFGVSFVPSLLQPIAEILANTDYAGRSVHNREYSKNDVASERGRKNTPEIYKKAAKWLNKNSGGNEAYPGNADFYPETLKKIAEGSGKNALKDAVTAYTTIAALLNGDFAKLDPRNTIVKRDFVREVPDNTSNFYDTKEEVDARQNEWKKRKAGMTVEERKAYLAEHPEVKQATQDRLNRLYNGDSKAGFRGIKQLRELIDGKVKRNGKWVMRETPPTDEQIEKWRAELRKKQAAYLEAVGR